MSPAPITLAEMLVECMRIRRVQEYTHPHLIHRNRLSREEAYHRERVIAALIELLESLAQMEQE